MINNVHLLEECNDLLEKINYTSQCLMLEPNEIDNNNLTTINKILSEFHNIIKSKKSPNYCRQISNLYKEKSTMCYDFYLNSLSLDNEDKYFSLIIQNSEEIVNILMHLHAISKEMLIPLYVKNDNQIINNYITSLIDNSMNQHMYVQYFALPISLYIMPIYKLSLQLPRNTNHNINYVKEILMPIIENILELSEMALSTNDEDPIDENYPKLTKLTKIANKLPLNLYQLSQILMTFIFKTNESNKITKHHCLNSLNNKDKIIRNIHHASR